MSICVGTQIAGTVCVYSSSLLRRAMEMLSGPASAPQGQDPPHAPARQPTHARINLTLCRFVQYARRGTVGGARGGIWGGHASIPAEHRRPCSCSQSGSRHLRGVHAPGTDAHDTH